MHDVRSRLWSQCYDVNRNNQDDLAARPSSYQKQSLGGMHCTSQQDSYDYTYP